MNIFEIIGFILTILSFTFAIIIGFISKTSRKISLIFGIGTIMLVGIVLILISPNMKVALEQKTDSIETKDNQENSSENSIKKTELCENKNVDTKVTSILQLKKLALAEIVDSYEDVLGNIHEDCYITRASKLSKNNPLLYVDSYVATMFTINGKGVSFSGKVGPAKNFKSDAIIEIKIYGDENKVPIYETIVRQSSQMQEFNIDVSGYKKIRIMEINPKIEFSFVMFTDMILTTQEKQCKTIYEE